MDVHRLKVDIIANKLDQDELYELFLYSIQTSEYGIIRFMLRFGKFDVSRHGFETVCVAVEDNDLELVKLLLDDSRIDGRQDDFEPLRLACELDHVEIASYLVVKLKPPKQVFDYCILPTDTSFKRRLLKALQVVA